MDQASSVANLHSTQHSLFRSSRSTQLRSAQRVKSKRNGRGATRMAGYTDDYSRNNIIGHARVDRTVKR